MSYSERFDEALIYASELHREQIRKGNGVPYITHLLGVASLVGANGGDEHQVIAALPHDAIEDGEEPDKILHEIGERFGGRVLEIVDNCTGADDHSAVAWRQRKKHYLEQLTNLPDDAPAVLVSLADKLHNSRAILRDLRNEGEAVCERFNRGSGGVLCYYGELADVLCEKRSGWLATELAPHHQCNSRGSPALHGRPWKILNSMPERPFAKISVISLPSVGSFPSFGLDRDGTVNSTATPPGKVIFSNGLRRISGP